MFGIFNFISYPARPHEYIIFCWQFINTLFPTKQFMSLIINIGALLLNMIFTKITRMCFSCGILKTAVPIKYIFWMLRKTSSKTWLLCVFKLKIYIIILEYLFFLYSIPGCAGCGNDIKSGQALLALDKQWHLWCFTCHKCGCLLAGEYMGRYDY